MADKVKVPTLNLQKTSTTAEGPLSQASTVLATDVDATQKPGSSFYTQRGATEEYLIPGLGNSDKKAKVEDLVEQEQDGNQKKKRKKRKKKNPQQEDDSKPMNGKKALKDELPVEELFADSDQSEDEGIADYKIGGYHSVHIGEVVGDRYVIVQKLGWGHFSTVWLARDTRYNSFVALKVQKSASHYLEAA